ncbi:MAG: hypothetical protein EXS37_09355 [Opitutus sp.]|nr:hypothetical protein [Opitutus sp.]
MRSPVLWPSRAAGEPTALERHRRHPGRQLATHAAPAETLSERVAEMPPAVLSYLIADCALNGFPTQPRPHTLNDHKRTVIAATFAALPPGIRTLAERYVRAIYVVDDLGSSAWTEFFDPPERQSFMVFDAPVLLESPNAWATRKERSGFADGTDLRLEIAEAKDDISGGAFRFIFLHELGHAIAYGRHLHPTWIDDVGDDFPFAKLVAGAKRFEAGVPFYAAPGRRLPAGHANDIYSRWSASDYPTMYATAGLGEDFAECFVSYVHVHLLRQPYRLTVGAERYDNGISHPRCAPKRAFVAGLLAP